MTRFKNIFAALFVSSILISSVSISSICYAKVPDYFFEEDKSLEQNYNLFVIGYDPRLGGVFEVQTSQDKRQRNHYTRLGDLSVSISKIDRNKYKRRPKKLVGKSFKIDKSPLKTYKAPTHIK